MRACYTAKATPVPDADGQQHAELARGDVLMPVGSVRDFDFHPDEDDVRVFRVDAAGVLRFDPAVFVSHARYDDAILWHYAFADHWFKVNLTTDLNGAVVETGASDAADGFAVNCDLATAMWQQDMAVYAVDLFLDVLVRSDGRTYRVCDVDELAQAIAGGQISANEAAYAAQGLTDLVTLIERGMLLPVGPTSQNLQNMAMGGHLSDPASDSDGAHRYGGDGEDTWWADRPTNGRGL